MASTAKFAYLQTRLQARHAARNDAAAWRRLQSAVDFANYLQLAQQTALRPWVMSLHAAQDCGEIEQTLRRLFRTHIEEVAAWVPATWRPAIRWVRRFPDLPALRHLLAGDPAPSWLREDPELRAFASEHIAIRLDAMRQSDCGVLVPAWEAGTPLWGAWLEHWQKLWPDAARELRGMDELLRLLRRQMLALQQETRGSRQEYLDILQARLVSAFRRYSFLPAAAFLHLALTSLDLARLRGDLLVRKLFRISPEQVA
jgi:hypothetical protein